MLKIKLMIQSKVYKLLKDARLPTGVELKAGQELEIVMDVVYMGGFPLPSEHQATFYSFITKNPTLFKDDTRNW